MLKGSGGASPTRLPPLRTLLLALVLASLLVPAGASDATVRLPCHFAGSAGPVDASCVAPIHPGARSSACTLNWVVTDGVHTYVGAAQHCVGALGQPLFVEGVSDSVGVLAWKGRNDSAFYRIDVEDLDKVSGSLEGWGGPTGVRTGVPGDTALVFGHGYVTEGYAALRGRPATVAYAYATDQRVILAMSASGGDSGSPVGLATGEALGFISAGVFVQNLVCPAAPAGTCDPYYTSQGVFAVSLTTELKHFSKDLKRPVTIVKGEPTVHV